MKINTKAVVAEIGNTVSRTVADAIVADEASLLGAIQEVLNTSANIETKLQVIRICIAKAPVRKAVAKQINCILVPKIKQNDKE